MLNWRRHERFLATDRRSVAALEFVLVAPILVILLFGVYDISTGMIFYEETYNTAHSIAASVSSLAVNQETGATALTFNQVQQAASEIWGGIPSLRADTQDGIKSVTISSVVFEKTSTSASCGTNGATPCYSPVVVWSEIYAAGPARFGGRRHGRQFDGFRHQPALLHAGGDGDGRTRDFGDAIVCDVQHAHRPGLCAFTLMHFGIDLRKLDLAWGRIGPIVPDANADLGWPAQPDAAKRRQFERPHQSAHAQPYRHSALDDQSGGGSVPDHRGRRASAVPAGDRVFRADAD
jgi:hypothetical protein